MHHVHADMWRMVLPPNLAAMGDTLERRVAPLDLPAEPDDHPVGVVQGRRCSRSASRPATSRSSRPASTPATRPGSERTPTPTVLAAGRLVPVKRYDLLIRAAVEARRRVPDLTLTIVGTGPLRGELEELVAVARRAATSSASPGWVSDDELLDLYRRSWLVASASAREGWGMTLTEAAACGTPAVATRIAGHADAVAEGVTGLLADDERGLADGIVAVATDAALRDAPPRGRARARPPLHLGADGHEHPHRAGRRGPAVADPTVAPPHRPEDATGATGTRPLRRGAPPGGSRSAHWPLSATSRSC